MLQGCYKDRQASTHCWVDRGFAKWKLLLSMYPRPSHTFTDTMQSAENWLVEGEVSSWGELRHFLPSWTE